MTLAVAALVLAACGSSRTPEAAKEPETLARTEFTDRIENFFEHEPLVAGKLSQFRIHLTDLSDGSPVERAEVTLTARAAGQAGAAVETRARVGRVAGIYVADVTVPRPGDYAIEFRVKNARLDERLVVGGLVAR